MRLRRHAPASPPTLTAETRAQLQKELDVNGVKVVAFDHLKCDHCGGIHSHACPRVRRMRFRHGTYGAGAQLTEVEFWPDGQWDTSRVLWPWDVFVDGPPVPTDGEPPTPELPSSASTT